MVPPVIVNVGFVQVALPDASEAVRTLPAAGHPPVTLTVQLSIVLPFTSSFAPGVDVPTPIFPPIPYIQFPIFN